MAGVTRSEAGASGPFAEHMLTLLKFGADLGSSDTFDLSAAVVACQSVTKCTDELLLQDFIASGGLAAATNILAHQPAAGSAAELTIQLLRVHSELGDETSAKAAKALVAALLLPITPISNLRSALAALGLLEGRLAALLHFHGALGALLDLLHRYAADVITCIAALTAANQLISWLSEPVALAEAETSCRLLVAVLHEHVDSEGLTVAACQLVAQLSLDPSVVNRRALFKVHAVEALLKALHHHLGNQVVVAIIVISCQTLTHAWKKDHKVLAGGLGKKLVAGKTGAAHADVAAVICPAARALAALTQSESDGAAVITAGGPLACAQLLDSHMDNADAAAALLLAAFKCIQAQSGSTACAKQWLPAFGSRMVAAVRLHSTHEEAARYVLAALLLLAASTPNHKALMDCGAAGAIIAALQQFKAAADNAVQACAVIVRLADSAGAALHMTAAGIIEELAAIAVHSDNDAIIESAISTIGVLMLNAGRAAAAPQVEMLTGLLQRTEARPSAVKAVGEVIRAFVMFSAQSAKCLLQLGAADALIQALRLHVGNGDVSADVGQSLHDMVAYGGRHLAPALTGTPDSGGHVAVLIQALRLRLQEAAGSVSQATSIAAAIMAMARNTANATELVHCGAAAVLFDALRAFAADPMLVGACLTTLSLMGEGCPPATPFKLPAECAAVVLQCVRDHGRVAVICEEFWRVMHSQLTNTAFCLAFCAAGGAPYVSERLQSVRLSHKFLAAQRANDVLAVIGSAVLEGLLDIHGVEPFFGMLGVGCIAILRHAATAGFPVGPRGDEVASASAWLCTTLGQLTLRHEASAEALIHMGAAEAIAGVLEPALKSGRAGIISAALPALRNIAAWPAARVRLVAAGIPASVVGAVRKYLASQRGETHAELLAAACGALRNLAASPENELF